MASSLKKLLSWIKNIGYIACFIGTSVILSLNVDSSRNNTGEVLAGGFIILVSIYVGHFVLVRLIDFFFEIPNKRKMKRIDDEKIYNQVLSEIESNNFRKGLMAKALAEAKGDEKKSRAIYIELRYQSIKDEQ